MSKDDGHTLIIQAEVVGKPFSKITDHGLGRITAQERRVRVVEALDETTGEVVYLSLDSLPSHIQPSDVTHLSADENYEAIDLSGVGSPSLNTIRKRGSSKVGADTEAAYESCGGSKTHKIPKAGGFKFKR